MRDALGFTNRVPQDVSLSKCEYEGARWSIERRNTSFQHAWLAWTLTTVRNQRFTANEQNLEYRSPRQRYCLETSHFTKSASAMPRIVHPENRLLEFSAGLLAESKKFEVPLRLLRACYSSVSVTVGLWF